MSRRSHIHIARPGMLTTIQDDGRLGVQAYGMPQGGSLDRIAHRIGNWLVGNPSDHPVLEITLIGPELMFSAESAIAIVGADLKPKINGVSVATHLCIRVAEGDCLTFGRPVYGCRAYLAIAGEWQVDRWEGSCAPVAGVAGLLRGNQIKKDSRVFIDLRRAPIGRLVPEGVLPAIYRDGPIRVMCGPEYEILSSNTQGQLLADVYRITQDSNRMGYRLDGPMEHSLPTDPMISSGVVPGTIQVTNAGQSIILLADGQSTGGYYRVANVISADMHRLAQLKPGDEIMFEWVTLEQAYAALRNLKTWLSFLP